MPRINPESVAFIFILGALGALPPLSIDMALPALSQISISLHRSIGDTTLTLSLFMAGFSLAQLVFGPISDRFGRRPVLLTGCGIFTLASLACAASPNLDILLISRFSQGCGAGAGMVMVFTMVSDLFDGTRARAHLSYVSLVLSIAPMISPAIGAWILGVSHWRTIYVFLGIIGASLYVLILFCMTETLTKRDPCALEVKSLLANYARIIRSRVCIGYMLINGLNFGCMFAYVAGSSFLMIEVFGLSAYHYSLTFGATSLGIMVGAFVSGKMSQHHVSVQLPLILGLSGALITSIALYLVTKSGASSLVGFLTLLILSTFFYGLVTPNVVHCALNPLHDIAGVAGASLGFIQMAGGSLASGLVAQLNDGSTAFSMTVTMTICSTIAVALFLLIIRPFRSNK